MIEKKLWTCVRQEAGPEVKIVLYQRPRLRLSDLPGVRKDKSEIIRAIRTCCFRRTPQDRLELMLALMGWRATTYVLTFTDQQLPTDFAGVRRAWAAFCKALRRIHGGAFDYVYVIEGLHGGRRWHIHAVLRNEDFSEEDVDRCWNGGLVLDAEPLMQWPGDKFRRTAQYFTKERRDGDRLPAGKRLWVASPSLYAKLEPPEKTMRATNRVSIPPGAKVHVDRRDANAFGAYRYVVYILPDARARDTIL